MSRSSKNTKGNKKASLARMAANILKGSKGDKMSDNQVNTAIPAAKFPANPILDRGLTARRLADSDVSGIPDLLFNLLLCDDDGDAVFTMLEAILPTMGYRIANAGWGVDGVSCDWMIAEPVDGPMSPIALVAHCDTVQRLSGVQLGFVPSTRTVVNMVGVLGADDRAGVYGLLEVAKATQGQGTTRPLLIFTNGEETGGTGVGAMLKADALAPWLGSITLFVELDRANRIDYVYYSSRLPAHIHDLMKAYGFKEDVGTYSDVADITDETRIPHVNLSIGYYGQHGKAEYLMLDEMEATIKCVTMMVQSEAPHLEEVDSYRSRYASFGYTNWGTDYDEDAIDAKPGDIKEAWSLAAELSLYLSFIGDEAYEIIDYLEGQLKRR